MKPAAFYIGLLAVACLSAAPAAEEPGKEKTVITGERMNLLQKGAAVEFTGGVTLTRGKDLLKADRMVSDEKNGFTQAWGRVYLRRDDAAAGARWEAWSDEAQYAKNLSSGTLWGKKEPARVVRKPLSGEGETLEMRAFRITFHEAPSRPTNRDGALAAPPRPTNRDGALAAPPDSPAQVMEAEKRVYVRLTQEETAEAPARTTEIWAGRGDYDGRTSSAAFRGAYGERVPESAIEGRDESLPLARQREAGETRELTGETISYVLDDRRLIAEGRVRAALLGGKGEKPDGSDRERP
jgi:hypothetical protein